MSHAARKNARHGWTQLLASPAALLRTHSGRRLAVASLLLAAIVAAALHLWQQLRSHVALQPEYLVAVADLVITPPPSWIHTDVKAAAVRDAGLPPKLSILDERLTERLSQAFLLNPWIQRVEKVQTSYPARVQVDLVYRRPVAMVEVYGGLLPIDAEAVLLPTEDFSPKEAQEYPRIAGVQSRPLGPLGSAWGDPVVAAAARLAESLRSVWSDLQLRQIAECVELPSGGIRVNLELVTRGGVHFIWGAAPHDEAPGESPAGKKLDRLVRWKEAGSLDAVPAELRDLRRPEIAKTQREGNGAAQ